ERTLGHDTRHDVRLCVVEHPESECRPPAGLQELFERYFVLAFDDEACRLVDAENLRRTVVTSSDGHGTRRTSRYGSYVGGCFICLLERLDLRSVSKGHAAHQSRRACEDAEQDCFAVCHDGPAQVERIHGPSSILTPSTRPAIGPDHVVTLNMHRPRSAGRSARTANVGVIGRVLSYGPADRGRLTVVRRAGGEYLVGIFGVWDRNS